MGARRGGRAKSSSAVVGTQLLEPANSRKMLSNSDHKSTPGCSLEMLSANDAHATMGVLGGWSLRTARIARAPSTPS